RVKLFRGAAARQVRCTIKILGDAGGGGRAPELVVTDAASGPDGVLSFTVPKAHVAAARTAHVIVDGTKEGFIFKLGANPAATDGRDVSMILRSLGFWSREPLAEGSTVALPVGAALAPTDVAELAVNMGLAE